jgi:threonine/homoserine/homoserine lactone efflux protein
MFAFFWQAIVISLSGVMAPGPVTAATLATGTRDRHSGLLIAVGHGIVEFPLMMLIVAGVGTFLENSLVAKIVIGFAGGAFLLHMGGHTLVSLQKEQDFEAPYADRHPVWIGIALTAGNPYFLLWWVSVGLRLSMEAMEFGALAFAVFAVLHWLCDAVWLETLSQASFRGTRVLGRKSMPIVLGVCAAALIIIGSMFVYDAGKQMVRPLREPAKHGVFLETRPSSAPATAPAADGANR